MRYFNQLRRYFLQQLLQERHICPIKVTPEELGRADGRCQPRFQRRADGRFGKPGHLPALTVARSRLKSTQFKKHCLLNGLDDIGLTMEKVDSIQILMRANSAKSGTGSDPVGLVSSYFSKTAINRSQLAPSAAADACPCAMALTVPSRNSAFGVFQAFLKQFAESPRMSPSLWIWRSGWSLPSFDTTNAVADLAAVGISSENRLMQFPVDHQHRARTAWHNPGLILRARYCLGLGHTRLSATPDPENTVGQEMEIAPPPLG